MLPLDGKLRAGAEGVMHRILERTVLEECAERRGRFVIASSDRRLHSASERVGGIGTESGRGDMACQQFKKPNETRRG